MKPEGLLPRSQSARHLYLYGASSIQSILPHPTFLKSIIILNFQLRLDKWVHIMTAWRVLRLPDEGIASNTEGRCEYIE